MKKILLIAALIAFTCDSDAQSAGPNELHCTEEAFTFKANISSGWHFSASSIGNQPFSGTTPASTGYRSSKPDPTWPEPLLLAHRNGPVNTSMAFRAYTTPTPRLIYISLFNFKPREPALYTSPFYRKLADQKGPDTLKFSLYTR